MSAFHGEFEFSTFMDGVHLHHLPRITYQHSFTESIVSAKQVIPSFPILIFTFIRTWGDFYIASQSWQRRICPWQDEMLPIKAPFFLLS